MTRCVYIVISEEGSSNNYNNFLFISGDLPEEERVSISDFQLLKVLGTGGKLHRKLNALIPFDCML